MGSNVETRTAWPHSGRLLVWRGSGCRFVFLVYTGHDSYCSPSTKESPPVLAGSQGYLHSGALQRSPVTLVRSLTVWWLPVAAPPSRFKNFSTHKPALRFLARRCVVMIQVACLAMRTGVKCNSLCDRKTIHVFRDAESDLRAPHMASPWSADMSAWGAADCPLSLHTSPRMTWNDFSSPIAAILEGGTQNFKLRRLILLREEPFAKARMQDSHDESQIYMFGSDGMRRGCRVTELVPTGKVCLHIAHIAAALGAGLLARPSVVCGIKDGVEGHALELALLDDVERLLLPVVLQALVGPLFCRVDLVPGVPVPVGLERALADRQRGRLRAA
eukprot:1087192-Rhodomonas_salina.1